ncbi:MAG: TetR/AcrR family transcriptional regulator [Reyranella sp.]|nr:TetR/AcrR family transcriptional regulator [Reyranella sp.]MBL6651409.1 TetR/AcrR family transcriptional regulator [Reyranella sp.]
MRVSRQEAAENRERIVEAASRLFRDKGLDGVGVDAIMKEAGLTHGGFYGHFASKDALAAEATQLAIERSRAVQNRLTSLGELAESYLSPRHRADRANGCPVAALGSDFARRSGSERKVLTAGIARQIDRIAELLKRGTAAGRRRRAIVAYAGMVGALTLSRAVGDPALAREILAAAKETFGKETA